MTYQPRFLYNSGVTFVTMPRPEGDLAPFLLPWKVQQKLGIIADIRGSDNNTNLTVVVTSVDNPYLEPWIEPVRQVLEYFWNEMVKRKLVAGTIPPIERINLFNIPIST